VTAALSGLGAASALPPASTAPVGDTALAIDFAALLCALGATPDALPADAIQPALSSGSGEAPVEDETSIPAAVAVPSLDAWQPPAAWPALPPTVPPQAPLPLPPQGPPASGMPVPPLPVPAAAANARSAVAAVAPAVPAGDEAAAADAMPMHALPALEPRPVPQPPAAVRAAERPQDSATNETPPAPPMRVAPTDGHTIACAPAVAAPAAAAEPAASAPVGPAPAEASAAALHPLVAPVAAHAGSSPALAPVPLTIAAPLHSPDFAAVLSVQVSVLARDGVQQAELRLNPAEMGPIAVRIDVADGVNATVHFAVDVAATREVLEAGLPELAGALREAGLTLVGGGVSDASAQRQRHGDGARDLPRRRGDAERDGRRDEVEPAPLLRRARGVVDLIA
jgi:hypothetical protein